jgi:aspartyl-tRNA(Asn)/glutamyl-tRNA(Gln) amidotransferase subunit A
MEGALALCPSFDTAGPLTRDVTDAALVWAALGGPRVDLAGASLTGTRLMVLDTIVTKDLDEVPGQAFAGAVDRLAAAGATILHGAVPELQRAYDLALPLYGAEAWAVWRETVEGAPDRMYPMILERLRGGAGVLAADYLAGWAALRRVRAAYAAATAGFDAVICPSGAILPPRAQAVAEDPDLYRAVNLRTLRNTRMGNLMGLTAISLPTGTPSCGIMLHAQPGSEGQLLRLALAAERALT